MMYRWIPRPLTDVALLIARIAIGVVFVAHGWQKLSTNGLDATSKAFQMMGVPAPGVSALYATFVELIGGAALILGALMPIAGLLLFLDMAGALLTVHIDKGLFVDKGGYELVLALGGAALALAVAGGGRYGVDGLLARRTPETASVPAGSAAA
jgi:putative oxidoreductase